MVFGDWIVSHEWSEITGTPSQMAQALGTTLDRAMRTFFPLITRRLRSDQDPWIDRNLEKMIERRIVLAPWILTTLSPLMVGRLLWMKRENMAWFSMGLSGTLT